MSGVAENLWDAGGIFCLPGHRLILRPMSKPGGAHPARYTHCRLWACPCHALASLALCELFATCTWFSCVACCVYHIEVKTVTYYV
jgi:hypothetical protein